MNFADYSAGEFAEYKGKPSHNSEGLQILEKYGIIKSGQIAYATRSLTIYRNHIFL